jgi:SAM-dependent methyltransferase
LGYNKLLMTNSNLDQIGVWNRFWDNKILQSVNNISREIESRMSYELIFKPYININTELCEIGCGSGIFLDFISPKVKKITGLDYSLESIAVAKNRLKSRTNTVLVLADVTNLKIKDKFDLVYSNGLIEHFKDSGKVIYNHYWLSKNGGYLIIIVPHKYLWKNWWYKLSRIKLFAWIWPYTEQSFYSQKDLHNLLFQYLDQNKVKQVAIKTNIITGTLTLIAKRLS